MRWRRRPSPPPPNPRAGLRGRDGEAMQQCVAAVAIAAQKQEPTR